MNIIWPKKAIILLCVKRVSIEQINWSDKKKKWVAIKLKKKLQGVYKIKNELIKLNQAQNLSSYETHTHTYKHPLASPTWSPCSSRVSNISNSSPLWPQKENCLLHHYRLCQLPCREGQTQGEMHNVYMRVHLHDCHRLSFPTTLELILAVHAIWEAGWATGRDRITPKTYAQFEKEIQGIGMTEMSNWCSHTCYSSSFERSSQAIDCSLSDQQSLNTWMKMKEFMI